MTAPHERLDETIDRVAAALTMVPADPALAERIAHRLQTERAAHPLAWRQLAAAAVALTAITLIAIALDRNRNPEITAHAPTLIGQQRAPVVMPTAPRQSSAAERRGAQTAPVTRQDRRPTPNPQAVIADSGAPMLDALPAPMLLAVDSLTHDPLTIAPVTVAPLDLETLTISEVGRDSPKE
jgi:hypothetical protein